MKLRECGATLFSATLLALAPWSTPARAQSLSAQFDWVMPERFAVPTIVDGGAAAHAGEVYTALPISPASWSVEFDACASTGPIAVYEWRIDGQLVDARAGCSGFSHDFPAEGSYAVALTVLDGAGGSHTRAVPVTVDDLLIVALGDSYGSGEGVPDVPVAQEDLDLAAAKQTARDSAEAALDAAQQSYLAALAEYQATAAQLDAALAAQQDYLDAKAAVAASCPLPVLACAEATAELTRATAAFAAALADIGLSNLDLDSTTSIRNAISNLRALAAGARDLALATRDAAAAALDAAQDELAAAIAALAPEWQNARCHRSAHSWQVQVAAALAADPHTSVTFVHLACSGATIQEGLIGPYGGIAPVGNELLAPQVDRARQLVCGAACDAGSRRVDAFLVSIGGNDANFADVIATCVLGEPCYDNPVIDGAAQVALGLLCGEGGIDFGQSCLPGYDDAESIVVDAGLDASTVFFDGFQEPATCGDPSVELDGCNGLDDLPANYEKLHARLASAFGADAASRVYLTAYPQLTLDENEQRCGWSASDSLAKQRRNLPGVTTAEMEWAGTTVTGALQATMSAVAAVYGWSFVDGHVTAFEPHGYCSTDGWIVRVQESPLVEASPFGAVHPNAAGQQAYAQAVVQAVPEPSAGVLGGVALLVVGSLADRRRTRGRKVGGGTPRPDQ
jgi:lysophospholipase L1-like esterase